MQHTETPCFNIGLETPDLAQYFKATILDPLKHWWVQDKTKLWCDIESVLIHHNTRDSLGAVALGLRPEDTRLLMDVAAVKAWQSIISTKSDPGKHLQVPFPSLSSLSSHRIFLPTHGIKRISAPSTNCTGVRKWFPLRIFAKRFSCPKKNCLVTCVLLTSYKRSVRHKRQYLPSCCSSTLACLRG